MPNTLPIPGIFPSKREKYPGSQEAIRDPHRTQIRKQTLPQESEIHLNLLRYLDTHPQVSQRELADHLGVSLGKTNYCLKALIEKGWVKANNFKNSNNKAAYAYLLTPKGIERKAQITVRYLRSKINEFEQLKSEIEQLESEIKGGYTND